MRRLETLRARGLIPALFHFVEPPLSNTTGAPARASNVSQQSRVLLEVLHGFQCFCDVVPQLVEPFHRQFELSNNGVESLTVKSRALDVLHEGGVRRTDDESECELTVRICLLLRVSCISTVGLKARLSEVVEMVTSTLQSIATTSGNASVSLPATSVRDAPIGRQGHVVCVVVSSPSRQAGSLAGIAKLRGLRFLARKLETQCDQKKHPKKKTKHRQGR